MTFMPNARLAFRAIKVPIAPSPMIPRVWPRGLCEMAAARVWQSLKSAEENRAAVVHQLRFRKVDRMRKIAKSATDSEDAAALFEKLAITQTK